MSLTRELNQLRTLRRPGFAGGLSDDMLHAVIAANAGGDNVLIAPPGQRIAIFELYLWNGIGAQTLIIQDGAQTLLRLSSLAAGAGTMLGYSGTGEPHFKVSAGNGLILNLSVGSLVDGFVKYKILS